MPSKLTRMLLSAEDLALVGELREAQKNIVDSLSKIQTTLEEIRDLLDLGMGDPETGPEDKKDVTKF